MKRFNYIPTALFVLFLHIHHKSIAQQTYIGGYVVTLRGDTLQGLVRLFPPQSSRLQKCYFKKNDTETPTVYSPMDIAGYGYENGRSLVSVSHRPDTLKKEIQLFMEYAVVGKLSLLRSKNDYFLYKATKLYPLVIETKEIQGADKSYVKTTLLFQDVIHKLVKPECPDILYKSPYIKENALVEVIKSYHQCIKSPYRVTAIAEKGRNSLHLYLQAGFQQMNMQVPTYGQTVDPSGSQYNVKGVNTTMPTRFHFFLPTIGVEWHLARVSNKPAVSLEVSQFKVNNSLNFRFDNYNYQKDFDDGTISHEYTLFRISPAIKYYLNNALFRPYLKFGLAFYSVQNEKSYLSVRSEVTTTPTAPQKTVQFFNQEGAVSFNKRPLGFLGVLGIDIPVVQKIKAFAELKAENMYMSYQAYSFLKKANNSIDFNNSLLAISGHIGLRF